MQTSPPIQGQSTPSTERVLRSCHSGNGVGGLGLGTEMLELPGRASSQEVSVNATGAREPAHLEEVDGTDRRTQLFDSSFLQKFPFLAQLLARLLAG